MTYKLESTHRVQTTAKEYVFVHYVKLVHNIEIRLITKIIGITLLTRANNSKIALFYILQIGKEEIKFHIRIQINPKGNRLLIVPRPTARKPFLVILLTDGQLDQPTGMKTFPPWQRYRM